MEEISALNMLFPGIARQEDEEESFRRSIASSAKSACRTSTLAFVALLLAELMYKAAAQCSLLQFLPAVLGLIGVGLGPFFIPVIAKNLRQIEENKNSTMADSCASGEAFHLQAPLAVAWIIAGWVLQAQGGLRGQIYEDKVLPDLYSNALWELAFCGPQIAISILRLPYRITHLALVAHLLGDIAIWLNGALNQAAAPNMSLGKSTGASAAPLWATLLQLVTHGIITMLCLYQAYVSENLARETFKTSSALEHQQHVETSLVEVVERLLCETFGCVAYVDASSTLNVLRVNAALEQLFGDNVVGQPLLCRANGVKESWRLVSYMRGIINEANKVGAKVPFMHEQASKQFVFQHSSGRSIHALTLAVYMPGSVKAGREACIIIGFRRLPALDASCMWDVGSAESRRPEEELPKTPHVTNGDNFAAEPARIDADNASGTGGNDHRESEKKIQPRSSVEPNLTAPSGVAPATACAEPAPAAPVPEAIAELPDAGAGASAAASLLPATPDEAAARAAAAAQPTAVPAQLMIATGPAEATAPTALPATIGTTKEAEASLAAKANFVTLSPASSATEANRFAAPGEVTEPASAFGPAVVPVERGVHLTLPEVVAASTLPAAARNDDCVVTVKAKSEAIRISLEENTEKPKSIGSIGHPDSCELPCKFVWTVKGCKDGDKCLRCHCCAWKKTRMTVQGTNAAACAESGQAAAPAKVPQPAFTTSTTRGSRKRQDKRMRKSSTELQNFDLQFDPQLDLQTHFTQEENSVHGLVEQHTLVEQHALVEQPPGFHGSTQVVVEPAPGFHGSSQGLVEQPPGFHGSSQGLVEQPPGFEGEFEQADLEEDSPDFHQFGPISVPDFQAHWSLSSSSGNDSKSSMLAMPTQITTDSWRQPPLRDSMSPQSIEKPSKTDFGAQPWSSWRPEARGFDVTVPDRGEEANKQVPCYINTTLFADVEVRNCFLHFEGLPTESAFRRDEWESRKASSEPGVGKWTGIRRSY